MRYLYTSFAFIVATIAAFSFAPANAQAATKYWIGSAGGSFASNSNWSTTSGGSNDTTAPSTSDVATFDGGNTNNATIDSAISVQGLTISSRYTGTITQSTTNTVTVGTSGYSQADGTFTGGSGSITISTSLALSGGTFTSTSGTLTISDVGGSTMWNQTGGTFNNNSGTVTFNVAYLTQPTITTTTDAFNNVQLTATGGNSSRINISSSMYVNGDITFGSVSFNTYLVGGTIYTRGNVSMTSSNWQQSSATILAFDSTGDQTIAATANGYLPGLTITKPSGTITASGDFKIGPYVQSSGTFTSTTGTMTVSYGSTTTLWNHTGGTFNHNNGTVAFNAYSGTATMTIDVPTSETFYNLTFDNSYYATTYEITTGDTLIATGTYTQSSNGSFGSAKINTGTIEAQGNVSISSNAKSGTATIQLTGTANQSFYNGAGSSFTTAFTINKASGTVTLSASSSWGGNLTLTSGTLATSTYNLTTAAYSQSGGTFSGGSGSVTMTSFTLSGGTFTSTSGTLSIENSGTATIWNHSAGTFTHNSGTVQFNASLAVNGSNTQTIDVPTSETFYNLTLSLPQYRY